MKLQAIALVAAACAVSSTHGQIENDSDHTSTLAGHHHHHPTAAPTMSFEEQYCGVQYTDSENDQSRFCRDTNRHAKVPGGLEDEGVHSKYSVFNWKQRGFKNKQDCLKRCVKMLEVCENPSKSQQRHWMMNAYKCPGPNHQRDDGWQQFAMNCFLGNMRNRKFKQKSGVKIIPDEKYNSGWCGAVFSYPY